MGMSRVYKKVARANGVTVKEVKREIQTVINSAWTDPINNNEITRAYQSRVPSKGKIPTPNELIRFAVSELRKEEGEQQ